MHRYGSVSGSVSFHTMLNENKQKQETNKQTNTFKSMYFLQGSTYSSVQSGFNFWWLQKFRSCFLLRKLPCPSCDNGICDACSVAAVLTSSLGRAFLTLVEGIRVLFPCFLIVRTSHEAHVCVLWCHIDLVCNTHCTVLREITSICPSVRPCVLVCQCVCVCVCVL